MKSSLRSSKLFYYLSFLSPREEEAFRTWIEIPLFNTEKRLRAFYAGFCKWVMNPEELEISREALFERVFPDLDYSPTELRKIMTGLTNLVLDFLGMCEFQNKDHQANRYVSLLKAFNRREMDKYFDSSFKRMNERIEAKLGGDVMHFHQKLELENEYNFYQISRPRGRQHTRFDPILQNLDIYYLGRRLKHTCENLNYERISSANTNLPLEKPAVNTLEKALMEVLAREKHLLPPAILIYYLIYNTLMEPAILVHFNDLKINLQIHAKNFSQDTAEDMYNYALNYAVRKFQEGNQDFLAEIGALYDQLFMDQILSPASINPAVFKNVVTVQARIGKTAWVEQFIDKFETANPDEKSKETVQFCRALLLFYREDYKGAKKSLYLLIAEQKDFFFGASARAYICKCCMELEDYNSLKLEMTGFQNYLRKWEAQFPKFHTYYSDFLTLLGKISHALLGDPDRKTERLDSIRIKLDNGFKNPTTFWVLNFLTRQSP